MSNSERELSTAPITALIFDMDGLLVDSEPASEGALRQFLADHGHELRPETVQGALGKRLGEAIAVIAETYSLSGSIDELISTFDALRLQALHGAVVAMPGAAELLDWAALRGIPTALATSSSRRQADVALAEAGLSGRFVAEATGDEVDHGKPQPDLFLLAATRLGVVPSACVVFEDAPAGLEAAAAAGMRRIWIPNAHTRQLMPAVSVDARLNSLLDVPGWLAQNGVASSAASPPVARTGTIPRESETIERLACDDDDTGLPASRAIGLGPAR